MDCSAATRTSRSRRPIRNRSLATIAALQITALLVFSTHGDPVGIGYVASLARPGGNATGLTTLLTELVAKELEAFKEALPQARRVGVLLEAINSDLGSGKAPREIRGNGFRRTFAKCVQGEACMDGLVTAAQPLLSCR